MGTAVCSVIVHRQGAGLARWYAYSVATALVMSSARSARRVTLAGPWVNRWDHRVRDTSPTTGVIGEVAATVLSVIAENAVMTRRRWDGEHDVRRVPAGWPVRRRRRAGRTRRVRMAPATPLPNSVAHRAALGAQSSP